MKELADGVWQLRGFPPNAINVYLMGDKIIAAATRHDARRILRQVEGHTVTAHALTHVHPDHQGSSKAICDRLGVPLWVGEATSPRWRTATCRRASRATGSTASTTAS